MAMVRYVTKYDGIVIIKEETTTEGNETRPWFGVYWTPDFLVVHRLRDGFAAGAKSLEGAVALARDWDPSISPIDDLGDFQLFARQDKGYLTISQTKEHGCNALILAKDVPSGSCLIGGAKHFFRYWKRRGAVSSDDRLVLSSVEEDGGVNSGEPQSMRERSCSVKERFIKHPTLGSFLSLAGDCQNKDELYWALDSCALKVEIGRETRFVYAKLEYKLSFGSVPLEVIMVRAYFFTDSGEPHRYHDPVFSFYVCSLPDNLLSGEQLEDAIKAVLQMVQGRC